LPDQIETPRVLIVDDDVDVREAVREVMTAHGAEVVVVCSVTEALGRLESDRFDLVLTDLRMPDRDGLEMLREVKRIDETLPVILMTGYGDLESSVEALRLEADDFLTKPLNLGELQRIVARAVEKGRLLRENRRQRARLEHLNRIKSEFLANISHELKTPLTTIVAASEALTDGLFGQMNAKQTSYLSSINDSGRHLVHLIDDLLDLAQADTGKLVLEVAAVAASQIVPRACAVVEGGARAKRIALVVDDSGVQLSRTVVRGDRDRIIQILVNLLSNAIKFSPADSVVTVSSEATDAEVRFHVRDQGGGIPTDALATIFAAFEQVRSGASNKDPGAGLGLPLSQHLAEMHGGDIRVESVLGSGSTFTLILPCVTEGELAATSVSG